MAVKPVTFGPFIRLIDSSTGTLTQPKGSIPRGSNLLATKRGALRTCDGSQMLYGVGGVPVAGRGSALAEFFFAPTGVVGYYLRLMRCLSQPLMVPQNLAATVQLGGSLSPSTTYYYVVTAVDGVGGETTASAEVSGTTTSSNKTILLTWNEVPNAYGYNVYRGTSPGGEMLLFGTGLPTTALQYADNGTAGVGIPTTTIIEVNKSFPGTFHFRLSSSLLVPIGTVITYAAGSDASYNGAYTVTSTRGLEFFAKSSVVPTGPQSNGGTISNGASPPPPPIANTSQQTALYMMPPSGNSYTDANIVAFFPAAFPPETTQGGYTPSGGQEGSLNLVPQMVQFTNQTVLALGNGFPPQVYSDATGTATNPAVVSTISSIFVDAHGVVTVQTATGHGIDPTQGVGANVIIAGVTNSAYDSNGNGSNAFTTIAIPDSTHVKFVNTSAIGQSPSSLGTMTVSTIPVISNFVPAFPLWTASVNYAVNSIIVPTVSNGSYYKAVQGGTSGGSQPTFPTGIGQEVADGQVIWRNAGLLNTAAPPPPGCGYVIVYAGSVWMFNTAPLNTSTGLDGPCSLRMSDVNNLSSWNPINQAFLDKDDGTEGLGMAAFTIAAQGIPPEGSMCSFKQRAVYQIVGVFGADNFAIQRAQSDLGILGPRTLQFVPGFGLVRFTYLGFAVFDGVNDRIISSQVEPYLIPSNDPEVADIIPIDQQWQSVAQSALTANPPMYCAAIPVGPLGISNGQLTRIMCFDLVLKAWAVIDLPFAISTMYGVVTVSTVATTSFGSYSDGTLQRWQAGDSFWATASAGSANAALIAWSLRTPTCSSKESDERIYVRRIPLVGQQTQQPPTITGAGGGVTTLSPPTVTIEPRNGGVSLGKQVVSLPLSGDFQIQGSVGQTGRRWDANISGNGLVTIDAIGFHLQPRPIGVMSGSIS